MHTKSNFSKLPLTGNNNHIENRGRGRNQNNSRSDHRFQNERFHSNYRRGANKNNQIKNREKTPFPLKRRAGYKQNLNQINLNANKLNNSHKRESVLLKLKNKKTGKID